MANLLVVDDSPTIRSLLTHILASAGFEVTAAEDGVRGLEAIVQEKVDLAIVDINMPVMDGLEMIRTLRADPDFEDLPVIILTTVTDADTRRRGLDAGANLFLTKPTPPAALLFQVRSLLGLGPADGNPAGANPAPTGGAA